MAISLCAPLINLKKEEKYEMLNKDLFYLRTVMNKDKLEYAPRNSKIKLAIISLCLCVCVCAVR